MAKGPWLKPTKNSVGKSTGLAQVTLICLFCMHPHKRRGFKEHWLTHKGKKYKVILILRVYFILIFFYFNSI